MLIKIISICLKLQLLCDNRYIIIWILEQIFMESDKVGLAAVYNNDRSHPPIYLIHSLLLDE